MLDAKLLNPRYLTVNGDSIPGPLIIGTFEKRAPGATITTNIERAGSHKKDEKRNRPGRVNMLQYRRSSDTL